MSAKPYIVQQDRPNLVIVPTGTYYEPPPKKVKKESVQNLPTPIKILDNSAFMKKTLNVNGRSVNNDVLIDVSKVKKPPASWASNFLQSIGGASPKFARLYTSAPKLSLSRKENTQLNSSEETTSLNTTNNQLNTNTVEIQSMMDKEKFQPKINLNLIKHKQTKPAPQSIPPKVSQSIKPAAYTKDISEPNSNTKKYQSKSDTTKIQTQVRKEPCLPKGYKIPIQSKKNKQVSDPQVDIKLTRPNTLKESDQVNNNAKGHKPVTQDVISKTESDLFKNTKETNKVKINKTEANQEKDSVKSIRYVNESKPAKKIEFTAKKTTPPLSHKKDSYKPKYNEEIDQFERNKENANSKPYKVTNQFKDDDDKKNKQRKTKETDLPRSYRYPCPSDTHDEITSRKSNKERAPSKNIKQVSKEKNIKEATYSTKLKTKKCNEISKTIKRSKSKHTLENELKKHKNNGEPNTKSNLPKTAKESVKASSLKTPQTVLSNKENTISRLKKKKATEKYNIEDKKNIGNETNTMKKKVSKTKHDERLSKSISPIKSVVKKIKMDHDKKGRYHKESNFHSHDDKTSGPDFNYKSRNQLYNSEKYLHKDTDVDLRAKLKRKITKHDYQKDQIRDRNKKNKFSTVPNGDRFVPDENLIISFNAKDDNEEDTSSLVTEKMSPKKKLARKKPAGGKKCKKIKLEINIVFDHADTTDEESISEDEASAEILENADLSFLDDFNVDEIVKSLNECKDSSKNYNGEVQDAEVTEILEILTSDRETNDIKSIANSQCSLLINNNETKSETAYCKNISAVENKTNKHEEMGLKTEVNQNRHHEVIDIKLKAAEDGVEKTEQAEHIQYLAVLDDVIVKREEINESQTIEGNTELHVNDNSNSLERQTASSVLVVEKSSSEHIVDQVKTEVDISQGTEITRIKNSQHIEVKIISNGTENISHLDNKNAIPMDMSQDNIIYNPGHDNILNEPTLAKLNNIELLKKNNINDATVPSKIDTKFVSSTKDKTGVTQSEAFEISIIEPDVIIIDDSDDETETQIKNNQSNKDNCATALECSKESIIRVESDEVIILDATDTDHNTGVESSDGTKKQLNKFDKNLNTGNLTLAENKENAGIKIADGTNKHDKLALEDTSTEIKIQTSAEKNYNNKKLSDDNKTAGNNAIHAEITKPVCDNKEKGNLSNADKVNEKMVIKPSLEPVNTVTKAVPPNAKPQKVNTKPECDNKENGNLSKADEGNEKIDIKTAEELPKSTEISHIIPKNSIPKAVPPNAKPQKVNTKLECDNKENDNLSKADEGNEKMVIKTAEELPKSTEISHVIPENSIPKAVPPNAKPQKVNTKPECDNKENGNLSKADEGNEKIDIKTAEELPKSTEISHIIPKNSIPKAVPPNAKPQKVNTKAECDNKENGNLSKADEGNEKMVIKTAEELPKSTEISHVIPENSIPKAVPPNAKPQKVNTKPECDNKENGNLSNADEANKKMVKKTEEETPISTEKTHIAPETGTLKTISPTKPQNVNTKVKAKTQDKESPANSENVDKVTKNNDVKSKLEICRSIANDVFVKKLETKLLSLMGQKYTITKLIRVGKFSKIYTCKDPRECNFTVKVIKNASDSSCLGFEKQNMICNLQNGVPENNLNCVRLIRGFPLCALWCFLMEYYPKTLAEALNENNRSFHIDEVQNLSRQLVSAVTILRNNNIIHSDIKPSHILINAPNTRIKLCGFDEASYFDGGKMLPCTGTINYRAPELILGYAAGYEIDVWSTALVMYEMATNRKLFPGIFNNDILFKQLCTLGSVPLEMLMQSSYRYKHFKGTAFCRAVGPGKSVIVHNIRGNDFLNNGLFQTYATDWAKKRNSADKSKDKYKLCAFSKLLHSMLAMFPKNRIAIEFVFANPFIYETFDNC